MVPLYMMVFSVLLFSCSKAGNEGLQPTTEVLDISASSHPIWAENATLYEVNVRQYTEEGTFNAFAESLPRLREIGVDILWFMPIHPIGVKERKGSLGSYYAVKDYRAVNPEFGSLSDFKSTVEKAHKLGFKVIIDWVANHSAPDHEWTVTNPDFYQRDENGEIFGPFDWSDVAQLDYSNKALWKKMASDMKFWIDEANIDGFRCDVAGLVPVEFWEFARKELESSKEDIWMLAENEDVPALLNKAFNANYGWSIHSVTNQIVKQEKTALDLANEIIHLQEIQPKGTYSIQFTTNHDENSWNGTVFERYGEAYKTMAVLTYTIPGMPLLYTGQEAGNAKRLAFFEKDAVEWGDYSYATFISELNKMKESNKALNVGPDAGSFQLVENTHPTKVLSFMREKDGHQLIALFNLSDSTLSTSISWPDSLKGSPYLSNQEALDLPINITITLKPWAYHIWTH